MSKLLIIILAWASPTLVMLSPTSDYIWSLNKGLQSTTQNQRVRMKIYSRPNCKLCTQAKDLLTARQLEFDVVNIDTDITKEALLEQFPQIKTIPVAVLDSGEILYGLNSIVNYVNSI